MGVARSLFSPDLSLPLPEPALGSAQRYPGGEARWRSFPTHKLIHLLPPPSTSTILLSITPDERAALQRPVAGVMPSRERRCSFGFELRP